MLLPPKWWTIVLKHFQTQHWASIVFRSCIFPSLKGEVPIKQASNYDSLKAVLNVRRWMELVKYVSVLALRHDSSEWKLLSLCNKNTFTKPSGISVKFGLKERKVLIEKKKCNLVMLFYFSAAFCKASPAFNEFHHSLETRHQLTGVLTFISNVLPCFYLVRSFPRTVALDYIFMTQFSMNRKV